jgi:nicotinamidase-related amidase
MENPQWNEFHEIVGALPEYGVVPGTTALMIIDMQYVDAHRELGIGKKLKERGLEHLGSYYFDRLEKFVVPNIQRLLNACRAADLPIIHVRIKAHTPDARDVSWRYKQFQILCPPGSKEAEILEELAPLPGEVVVDKHTSGVFNSTNIDSILRNMGIDTLIVTGVVTYGCVETSTRGAMDRNYKVLLVEDACAGWSQEAHDAAIRNLHRNFAVVRTTADILRQIAEASQTVPIGASVS